MKPTKEMPDHLETGQTCLACRGPQGMDDQGACAGNGAICKRCGCWRLPRHDKTEKFKLPPKGST